MDGEILRRPTRSTDGKPAPAPDVVRTTIARSGAAGIVPLQNEELLPLG